MFPATLQRRAVERVENMLHPMRYFVVFRVGDALPHARIGTRAFATPAEGVAKLTQWYPGCLIYAYNPEA